MVGLEVGISSIQKFGPAHSTCDNESRRLSWTQAAQIPAGSGAEWQWFEFEASKYLAKRSAEAGKAAEEIPETSTQKSTSEQVCKEWHGFERRR
jgi:hypothetical protein